MGIVVFARNCYNLVTTIKSSIIRSVSIFAVIFMFLVVNIQAQTVTLQTGYNLVGCNVNGPNGNDISDPSFLQIPESLSDPNGGNNAVLYSWHCGGSLVYVGQYFSEADALTFIGMPQAGWYDQGGNIVAPQNWNPGEGMIIYNPNTPENIVFNGTQANPVFPPTYYCGCGQWSFLCPQTAQFTNNYQNITGFIPQEGAQVSFKSPTYTNGIIATDIFTNGTWTPNVPVLYNGQSAFFWIPCASSATLPSITYQPRSQTLPVGSNATFNVTATGTQQLIYNWYFNGVQISSSTSNLLTISSAQIANAGNYWVIVQNAGGSVTSQVARLYMAPQAQPSGLGLYLTNQQGSLLLTISDDGSSGFPWQLQSTTNLSSAVWVNETNGVGKNTILEAENTQMKFFRVTRLQLESQSEQFQAVYGSLPTTNYNSSTVIAPGSFYYPSILNSDGNLININTNIPSNQILSSIQFFNDYNAIRLSSLNGAPIYPDLDGITVSIDPTIKPITLAHSLAVKDINALSLAIIPYNTIDPTALTDGRLVALDTNNIPIGISNTNFQYNVAKVINGTNPSNYVQSQTFAGTGMFDIVLQPGDGLIKFMLPKEYLVTTGIVSSIQICFPGVPLVVTNGGTNISYSGFVDIFPDQMFAWDFSSVDPGPNNTVTIPYVVRVTIGESTYDAVGTFKYYRLATSLPDYDCQSDIEYAYPKIQPSWWPLGGLYGSWATLPTDPATFYNGPKPGWWPNNIDWPCTNNWYFDGYNYQMFGILTSKENDIQTKGPAVYSPSDYLIKSDGYYLRYYPASYRKCNPNGCQAQNLVLIVDGIDVLGNRTENKMWADFGLEGQKLLDKGYDLLVLNYINGNDPIERNAYALLDVLQNWVPRYMAEGHSDDRVTIIAASMGTQVTRYALKKAELANIDHHTGLAIYLDGPFVGANMPWSMQNYLWFLGYNSVSPSTDAQKLVNGLLSPAARQLLRTGINYCPAQAYYDYYGEVNLIGLPTKVRNVAVSCGSGFAFTQGAVDGYGESNYYDDKPFALIHTGQVENWAFGLGLEWGQADVVAVNDDPSQTVPPLKAELQGAAAVANLGYKDSLIENWISLGQDWQDFAPGGYTTLSKQIVQAYNDNAPAGMDGMSGIGVNTFIPLFSAFDVQSAEIAAVTYEAGKFTSDYINNNYVTINILLNGTYTQPNYFYDPQYNSAGQGMDPNTPLNSPFDAIWYQYTNIEHVVTTGDYLAPGYEAFVFNELDQFSSQEAFTGESVMVNETNMPSHEAYLTGDLLYHGVDDLLTINTMTQSQMVQELDDSGGTIHGWKQLIDTTSPLGYIGSWKINRGDKYYLARLSVDGPKLLVSFSASTPASVMVQQFIYNSSSSTYYWQHLWDNAGSGKIGPLTIHTTDIYSFGDPDLSGFDKLLVAQPYVCNDFMEKIIPGTSGLSKAALLTFNGISGWSASWDNYSGNFNGTIDMLGSTAIRFGDCLMFGHLLPNANNTGPGAESLFSVNLLRNIFGGPTMLQSYDDSSWNQIWSDNGIANVGCNGCSGNIGCWNLGNPRDKFHFMNLGGAEDLLACMNDTSFDIYSYDNSQGQWCYNFLASNSLGSYPLNVGDRFIFGHFSSLYPGDLVLCLNPLPQPLWCGPRKDATLIHIDLNNNPSTVWTAPSNSRTLGNWSLYQDLP